MGTGEEGCSWRHEDKPCTDGGFEPKQVLEIATDKERADILSDIVGHPKASPSIEELVYMNPGLTEDTIRRCLSDLTEAGIVRERQIGSQNSDPDFPSTFYEVTAAARDVFDREGLFPAEAWQRQYEAVDRSDRIRALEQIPRPDN